MLQHRDCHMLHLTNSLFWLEQPMKLRVLCCMYNKQNYREQGFYFRCLGKDGALEIGHSWRNIWVCPQWGLNSSVPCSANWAREESVGDAWSELSFVSCTTSHVGLCLFLESIEHDFIKALMIHKHKQIAQLAEHETEDLEVVSSNLTGDNFWQNLFCSV